MDRFERLANAFGGLVDTLTDDFDAVELTQQLIDHAMTLLPIAAAGIVLSDCAGKLQVFASSSHQSGLLELLQLHADAGPCLEAYRTGEPVFVDDLSVDPARWPAFAVRAVEYRLRAVSALPLRSREERVGALNLFRAQTGPMPSTDVAIGQALADVAAVGITHQRKLSHSAALNQQLQSALDTRLIIEQAKGVLAERGTIDMDRAFTLLRAYARRTRRRLADVAHTVVDGVETDAVLDSGSNGVGS
jgi:GAF domain-containing protein